MTFRIFVSPSNAERLSAARDVVRGCAPGARVLIVGASRGAADDLVRGVAADVPATFGIQRLSLTQLAARTALVALAADGTTPSTRLGAEAITTRAVFDATRDGALAYFAPVAKTPGFPRALARTLQELRLAGLSSGSLAPLPLAGPDLAVLFDCFEACFGEAASVDRADLFRTAAAVLRESRTVNGRAAAAGPLRGARATHDVVLFLDVPLDHAAEREFVAAVIAGTSTVLATSPHGDRDTIEHLAAMGGTVEGSDPLHKSTQSLESAREGGLTPLNDLACLRRFLFNTDAKPPHRELDGSVEFFSAPGEGRECVEMARRVLREARAGVRFDEMAILVRSPQSYFGLLEHALRRAEVPAWFDRGTRRPHPSGRAFLALLACAAEHLSAGRFAEYLSLGQVPGPAAPALQNPPYMPSSDEVFDLPEEAQTQSEDEGDRGSGIGNWGSGMRKFKVRPIPDPQSPIPRSSRARSGRRGGGKNCWWRRPSSATTPRAGSGASPARLLSSRRRCVRRNARMAATAAARTRSGRSRSSSCTSRPLRCRSSRNWPSGRALRRGASGSTASSAWPRASCVCRRRCCGCSPTCGPWPMSARSIWRRPAGS